MKKRKWNVETLLSGALALLGFAGCSSNSDEPGDYPVLYGTPSVDYRVLGTVTDTQGKPLEGIQVVVENPYVLNYFDENGKPAERERDSSGMMKPDTLYTDKDGKFSSSPANAISDSELVVEFQDIDGEANGGEFQLKRLTRNDFDKKQLKKEDSWYAGGYEYSQAVQLKRKDE